MKSVLCRLKSVFPQGASQSKGFEFFDTLLIATPNQVTQILELIWLATAVKQEQGDFFVSLHSLGKLVIDFFKVVKTEGVELDIIKGIFESLTQFAL